MPRKARQKKPESPADDPVAATEPSVARSEQAPTLKIAAEPATPIPDEALPAFPVKMREPFPHAPMGFEARGTFEAAGVRVTRHADGRTALQFKDGAAMGAEEKADLQGKGYRYVPGDKQWANPDASWSQKVEDARALSEARTKDRER